MPVDPNHPPLRGPAPITVHDDRNMPRHLLERNGRSQNRPAGRGIEGHPPDDPIATISEENPLESSGQPSD